MRPTDTPKRHICYRSTSLQAARPSTCTQQTCLHRILDCFVFVIGLFLWMPDVSCAAMLISAGYTTLDSLFTSLPVHLLALDSLCLLSHYREWSLQHLPLFEFARQHGACGRGCLNCTRRFTERWAAALASRDKQQEGEYGWSGAPCAHNLPPFPQLPPGHQRTCGVCLFLDILTCLMPLASVGALQAPLPSLERCPTCRSWTAYDGQDL